jgi:hypothetical protein
LSQNTICLVPFWGLKQLYQSRLSSFVIYVLLITCGVISFGLLQAIFSGVNQDSAIYNLWPRGSAGLLVFSLMLGAGSGFFLATIVAVSRIMERKLHPKFVMLDATVDGALLHAVPTYFSVVGGIVITTIIMSGVMGYILSADAGLSLLNPADMLAAGEAVFVQVYLLNPLYFVIAGLGVGAFVKGLQYLIHVAREITIDILKAEAYSGITIMPAIIFAVSSMLFAVLGVAWIFGDSSRITSFLQVWALVLSFICCLAIAVSSYPMVVLKNRIALKVQREKDALASAILGDTAALGDSCLAEPGMGRAELMMCLGLANTLSEWPIGAQIRKIVLFGVLPPIAWSLAAIVENTIY